MVFTTHNYLQLDFRRCKKSALHDLINVQFQPILIFCFATLLHSDALKSNDMWEKIGVTEERGNNEAIEASIRAPTRGGGDKEARMERAQALITACKYQIDSRPPLCPTCSCVLQIW